MTLIAIHTTPAGAMIMTDTMVSPHVQAYPIGSMTKVKMFNHLQAAIICQGGAVVDRHWIDCIGANTDLVDFDDLAAYAEAELPDLYRQLQSDVDAHNATTGNTAGARLAPAVVFHVGYSQSRERYVGLSFSSDEGFVATEIDTMHVMPSPLGFRPSAIEERRLRRLHRERFQDESDVDAFAAQPEAPIPATVEDWRRLALLVREQRSLANIFSGFKTMIGGDVVLTVLKPSETLQVVLHQFDNTGEEFREMLRGTLHPLGQTGPCPCGSDARFLDCCLALGLGDRCPCGSGGVFADCCMVDASEHAPA